MAAQISGRKGRMTMAAPHNGTQEPALGRGSGREIWPRAGTAGHHRRRRWLEAGAGRTAIRRLAVAPRTGSVGPVSCPGRIERVPSRERRFRAGASSRRPASPPLLRPGESRRSGAPCFSESLAIPAHRERHRASRFPPALPGVAHRWYTRQVGAACEALHFNDLGAAGRLAANPGAPAISIELKDRAAAFGVRSPE